MNKAWRHLCLARFQVMYANDVRIICNAKVGMKLEDPYTSDIIRRKRVS